MENRTPFDLNEAIRRWQQNLGASPALTADNVEELAAHLRASVQKLQADGLSEEEAFQAATRRLGERAVLEQEFAKVAAVGPRPPEESVKRIVSLLYTVCGIIFIACGIIAGFALLFTDGHDAKLLVAQLLGAPLLGIVLGTILLRHRQRLMPGLIQKELDRTLRRLVPAKVMQSTWSPFQSPEVRDICAHLTAAEKQLLLAQASDYGRETGRRLALPATLFGVSIAFSFLYAGPLASVLLVAFITVAFMIYCWTVDRQRRRAQQKRVREFLAATEYAREQGYRPEALRMFALPWSR